MLGLAIHTSSPQLGLMIHAVDCSPDRPPVENRYQVWDLGREVSSQLHDKMMAFVAPHSWQDLSFVAVAKGPGGFTGTRIGVVAARTLAQQLDIPLFGVSSLAAIAAQALVSGLPDINLADSLLADNPLADNYLTDNPLAKTELVDTSTDIVVTMPAKRGAVYGAILRPNGKGELKALLEEAVRPQTEWAQIVEQWQDNGQAIRKVTTETGTGVANSVTGVMALALARWQAGERPEWASVMPFYGQHPVHR